MPVRELERQLASVGWILARLEGDARIYRHAATGHELAVNTIEQHHFVAAQEVDRLWCAVKREREALHENA